MFNFLKNIRLYHNIVKEKKKPFILFLSIEWFLILKKTWIPFTQVCFVPSLVEIGPLVLEKKILKFCQCISAISLLCPLGKMPGISFEQTWISFSQECFVLSLVEIGIGSGEKGKNVKSLQTDREKGRQMIKKSSLEHYF